MKPEQSRFVFLEFLVRFGISMLAMFTILIVIFTTPKGDVEGVIDQTMNFTALVILLEIDNILGVIYQKKIDKYEIDFSYNKETIEEEFNKAADFTVKRQEIFWIQRKFENLIQFALIVLLYTAFTVFPVGMLCLYIIIPPVEIA